MRVYSSTIADNGYFRKQYYWSDSSRTDQGFDQDENPKNFIYVSKDLIKLIRAKCKLGKIRKDFIDHYLYICGTIAFLHYVDKRYKNLEYSPINYKIMISKVSKRNGAKFISDLTNWNVIECDNTYEVGIKSFGYKLKSPHDKSLVKYEIKDKLINQKLNEFKENQSNTISELHPSYKYLEMTNSWIKIDRRKAFRYNSVHYDNPYFETVYNSNFYSISAYADKNYRFTVDSTGYRAHTNLTNFSSDLRKFLSVKGSSLVQIDIKNSQPLFLYLVIKDERSIPEDEKLKYRTIVEEGCFYEFFMTRLNIPLDKRDETKPKILASLFFDRMYPIDSRYVKIFREEFPNILEYIKRVKKDDHRQMAILLQRAESKFVIEKAVGRFVEKFGGDYEFISTIHDSLVVKPEMADIAQDLLRECFLEEGIDPKLKISEF